METIHPIIIHFPIVFYIIYFVTDAAGIIAGKENMTKPALAFLFLAIFFSIAAVLTGNLEAQKVNEAVIQNPGLQKAINNHELFSSLFLWLCASLFFYRFYTVRKNINLFYHKLIILFFAIIGFVLILITAYYGGLLVYEFGVGTKIFGG
ncbi:DUF2231 domain-containing protein [Melioribacter sp. Ez-97]|uniref:DUF2231 domain-containing protein n=1 Tax=Melioribacter sp. Ez-97 TaxID=3423434 RepID=UPI003ED90B8D